MRRLPLVTVITPTATCGALIHRATESVRRQDYPNIEHVIVGDALEGPALTRLHALVHEHGRARAPSVINSPEPRTDRTYRPARAAHARTVGARRARGSLLAFLDDDNEFEPDHISALVHELDTRPDLQAVYSWRQLFTVDGSPYVAAASPWAPTPDQATRDYLELVAAGVWVPGTNLLRDSLGHNTVDSSCWLLRRSLLDQVPFRVEYSSSERRARLGEDVAFCFDLRRQVVPVAHVPRHSVRYYVGGFSTSGSRNYIKRR